VAVPVYVMNCPECRERILCLSNVTNASDLRMFISCLDHTDLNLARVLVKGGALVLHIPLSSYVLSHSLLPRDVFLNGCRDREGHSVLLWVAKG